MTPNIDKIIEHYNHARDKHPYFCDGLLPSQVKNGPPKYEMMKKIAYNLQSFRIRLKRAGEIHNLLWNEVLNAEVWEVTEAIAKGKKRAAIEEAYDCIAVLLRVIDVLEGRQNLGKPEEVKK